MVLILILVVVLLLVTLIFLTSISKHGALFEFKNNFLASYPAIFSNVEDVLFSWSDRVCKLKSQLSRNIASLPNVCPVSKTCFLSAVSTITTSGCVDRRQ